MHNAPPWRVLKNVAHRVPALFEKRHAGFRPRGAGKVCDNFRGLAFNFARQIRAQASAAVTPVHPESVDMQGIPTAYACDASCYDIALIVREFFIDILVRVTARSKSGVVRLEPFGNELRVAFIAGQ